VKSLNADVLLEIQVLYHVNKLGTCSFTHTVWPCVDLISHVVSATTDCPKRGNSRQDLQAAEDDVVGEAALVVHLDL